MSRKVAILASVVVITLALAIVFWIVNIIFAPHIFFFVWSHIWPSERSALALVALAATGPLMIALPFGFAFGLFPWRQPMVIGFLVAAVAASLNLAHSVWASIWAGYPFVDSRTWVVFLEAALLIILFGAGAALGARAASQWRRHQRLVAGGVVWVSLTAITLVSAYAEYQSMLGSARAA